MSLKRGDTGEEAPLLVGGRVCQTIVGGYIYVTHPYYKNNNKIYEGIFVYVIYYTYLYIVSG
jgi:hypothetical protein